MKKIKKNVLMIVNKEKPPIDVIHYFIGNFRYYLYYSKWLRFLLKKHIKHQIRCRLVWMNQVCYNKGSCIKCGCEVPQLQMANKSCDANCYPLLMNKNTWKRFMNGTPVLQNKRLWCFNLNDNTITLIKQFTK